MSESRPPSQSSRTMNTCVSLSNVSTNFAMFGWEIFRMMAISSQIKPSSVLHSVLMATWAFVVACQPSQTVLVSPSPRYVMISYESRGWPCVCVLSPALASIRTEFRGFPSRSKASWRTTFTSSPPSEMMDICRSKPSPSSLAQRDDATVPPLIEANDNNISTCSSRSASMVPTKRPLRLLTQSTRATPGFTQPLYIAGPS
mmetsp:Transcript_87732/g.253034  ORF Transcript_87732/g.253034 Transcript_87732/m.253034 type:complete len:201 (+) Transcript_87732:540-1142(+)